MAFTAGQKIRASDLNRLGQIVGWNSAFTAPGGIGTTNTPIISTSAPVLANRIYRIVAFGDVAPSLGGGTIRTQHEIRFTVNNTEPTTSSSVLGRSVWAHSSTIGQPDTVFVETLYTAPSTATLRVLLCSRRVDGSLTFSWVPTSNSRLFIYIQYAGDLTPANGTVY